MYAGNFLAPGNVLARMKAMFGALWTLFTQLLLGLIGQPVPGQSRSERERNLRQARAEPQPAGAREALRAVLREALYALAGQPSPEARSAASRRRPRL